MSQPSVAIVILTFNGKKFLEDFLPSVLATEYDNKQIVVADNASTDGSFEFMQKNYPQIKVLCKETNAGFAGGYNWALKQMQADYYVLLNSDIEVTPNWINPVIDLMEGDKSIGACQPKILSYYDKASFEYAGAAGGWMDSLGYPFNRGRVFDTVEEDQHQYQDVQEIFWATGASLFIRSEVFHNLNGFDESFFAHQEEIDLCWRIQLAGYRIMAVPASEIYHIGGGTLKIGYQKTYLNFRNNLMMLYKNLTPMEKVKKIPFRLLLDFINAWRGLASGDGITFKAIFIAHLHFIKWVFTKEGKHKLNRLPLKNLGGVYSGSIVWQYFVKGRKTFLEIVDNKRG